MSFQVKQWQNLPVKTTPIDAAALIDLETRLSNYTDSVFSTSVSTIFGRNGTVTAQVGDYTAAQVTNAADKIGSVIQSFLSSVEAPSFIPSGYAGAQAATRWVGATVSGHPTSGNFSAGDFIVDQTGSIWVCTLDGSPGTWVDSSVASGAVDLSSPSTQAFAGNVQAPAFVPSGLFGAGAASRIVGATTGGPPTSGIFSLGDVVIDQTGYAWACTAGGSPGTWVLQSAPLSGLEATMPVASPSNAGFHYRCTDSSALFVSDGSAWRFISTGDPYYWYNGGKHVRETFPRITQLTSDLAGATSGTVRAVPITLYKGDVITSLSFKVGATAAVSPTHWWLALYDQSQNLIVQTADQGNAALAAQTSYTKNLSSPYTVTASGSYWVAISVTAGTVPSIYGKTSTGSGYDSVVASQKITSWTFGSAVLGAAPANIATPTAAITIPYIAAS